MRLFSKYLLKTKGDKIPKADFRQKDEKKLF